MATVGAGTGAVGPIGGDACTADVGAAGASAASVSAVAVGEDAGASMGTAGAAAQSMCAAVAGTSAAGVGVASASASATVGSGGATGPPGGLLERGGMGARRHDGAASALPALALTVFPALAAPRSARLALPCACSPPCATRPARYSPRAARPALPTKSRPQQSTLPTAHITIPRLPSSSCLLLLASPTAARLVPPEARSAVPPVPLPSRTHCAPTNARASHRPAACAPAFHPRPTCHPCTPPRALLHAIELPLRTICPFTLLLLSYPPSFPLPMSLSPPPLSPLLNYRSWLPPLFCYLLFIKTYPSTTIRPFTLLLLSSLPSFPSPSPLSPFASLLSIADLLHSLANQDLPLLTSAPSPSSSSPSLLHFPPHLTLSSTSLSPLLLQLVADLAS
ncbi:unnamed protein product [Closterium sp. Naga37s-1]|nr:unnamed protein product [Closterium sp. Naga37s-1]